MRKISLFIIFLLVISSISIGSEGSSILKSDVKLKDDAQSDANTNIDTLSDDEIHVKNVKVEFSEPTIQMNGNEYFQVAVDGCFYKNIPGQPQLPVKNVVLKFAPGTKIQSVGFEPDNNFYLNVDSTKLYKPSDPIYAVTENTWEGFEPPLKHQLMDDIIYKTPKFFPEDDFEYSTGMGIDPDTGETTLFLVVRISPVKYQPVDNIINWLEAGTIKVEYLQPPASCKQETTSDAGPGTRSTRARDDLEYDMVIITPIEFSNDLTNLVDHKNSVDLSTIMITFTDITSGKYFTAQGVDTQEKIKYFIYNAKKDWNIQFVMLVGDSDKFPIRNGYIHQESGNVPSDLYYADVFDANQNFCDWDGNGNGIYGENDPWQGPLDGCDLYPDVFIGRLPASTNGELQTMVNKIINYELTAIGQSWTNNAILCGLDTFSGGTPEGEYLSNYIAQRYLQGYSVVKLYESTSTLSSSAITSNINSGAKFLSFSDHGLVNSWGGHYSKSDVNSLTNGGKLPFVNLDACLSGAFDNGDCLAESFLLRSGGGGIASFAASRVAYGANGQGHIYTCSGYINIRLYANYHSGRETPGEMVAAAKWDYLNNVGKNSYTDFKTVIEYNLFGDPSLVIGGLPTAIFDLECNNNQTNVDPGESAEYQVTVINLDINFNKVTLKTSGVPSGWNAVLDETEHYMEPDTQAIATLTVTAPLDAEFKENANIKVVGSLSHIQRTISVSTKTKVNRIFGVSLDCEENEASIDPGTTTKYDIVVNNDGNYLDTIKLEIVDIPYFWDVKLNENTIFLDAFGSEQVELTVTTPPNTIADTYSISIKGTIQGTTITTTIATDTIINPIYNIKLNYTTNHYFVKPSESAYYRVNAVNNGNTYDNIVLRFENLQEDWNVMFKDKDTVMDRNRTIIDPFSSKEIEVIINISEYTLAGDYNLTLAGISESNMSKSYTWMIAAVKRIKEVELNCYNYTSHTEPNGTISYKITVSNKGNWEDVVKLQIAEAPKNWEIKFSSSTSIRLDAFKSTEVEITITPPLDALVGNYDILVKGILESDNNKTDYARVITGIDRIYGVELAPNLELSHKVDPGKTLKYGVKVTNMGNAKDTADVVLVEDLANIPGGWSVKLQNNNDLTLAAFESKDVELIIEVPSNECSGNYKIPLRATIEGSDDIKHVLHTIISINQIYGIEITSYKGKITVQPGEKIEYVIKVANNGNGLDEVSRRVKNLPTDWEGGFAVKRTYILKPFESKNESLQIAIPPDTKAGEYQIDVMVVSLGDSEKYDTIDLVIEVKEEESPGISVGSFGFTLSIIVIIIIVLFLTSLFLVRRKRKAEPEADQAAAASNVLDYRHHQSSGNIYQQHSKWRTPKMYDTPRPTVASTSGTGYNLHSSGTAAAPPGAQLQTSATSRWGITPTRIPALQTQYGSHPPQLPSGPTTPTVVVPGDGDSIKWFDEDKLSVRWEDDDEHEQLQPESQLDDDLDMDLKETAGKDIDSLLDSLLPADARTAAKPKPTFKIQKPPKVIRRPKIKSKAGSK